jgi:hypothetical protein
MLDAELVVRSRSCCARPPHLSAAWQGKPAEQPPDPEPVETDAQRQGREHRELLVAPGVGVQETVPGHVWQLGVSLVEYLSG